MVSVKLVPLLGVQRALYDIPRGPARFNRYLEVLKGGHIGAPGLPPLVNFNPMGKAGASEAVDALLALDAESIAADALVAAESRLAALDAEFSIGLVVTDDAQGGWTRREFVELEHRTQPRYQLKQRWSSVLCWTSVVPTSETVRQDVLASVFRTVWFSKHGLPKTLGDLMRREGLAASFAGVSGGLIDDDELVYTRQVIAPFLDSGLSANVPTVVACLYGDASARALGFTPLGLSPRAGYALALHEAVARGVSPEEELLAPDHAFPG